MERAFDDHTSNIEEAVQKENSPDVRHLIRLFRFVFSSTKGISIVYMGTFLLLFVLRPVLAYIGNGYIRILEEGYFVIAKTVSVFSIAGTLYIFHLLLCLMVLIAPFPTIWVNTIGNSYTKNFADSKLLRNQKL